MPRIRLDIAYNGTDFHGWADQPDQRTVQGDLTSALQLITQQDIQLTVAGRTDAGVHATRQVAHFDLPDNVGFLQRTQCEQFVDADTVAKGIDAPATSILTQDVTGIGAQDETHQLFQLEQYAFARRINSVLASRGVTDIVVTAASVVSPQFDARFGALYRKYCYRIGDTFATWQPTRTDIFRGKFPLPLDVELMNRAAQVFVGEHDFLAFAKPREGASTVREIFTFSVYRAPGPPVEKPPLHTDDTKTFYCSLPDGSACVEPTVHLGEQNARHLVAPKIHPDTSGHIECWVQGDAFCHSQVRFMVGALIDVGRGLRDIEWVVQTLAARQRTPKVQLAPACGLTLEQVAYPETVSALAEQSKRAKRVRTLPAGR
ncbi:MAG: tRNA pseudouridine synthase A [Actinomycetaceae bacterium]|nr:tRNA pseudouridine synthase A [Actinomycetaceae bacterium]